MVNIAAIDVGSNAMRMTIGAVGESWQVRTIENIRLPIRLGRDVFSNGYLEEGTIQQTEEAFLHFKHIARNFDVNRLRAVATSAVRLKTAFFYDRVLRTSGIEIEIISRRRSASHHPGGHPRTQTERPAQHAASGRVDKRTLMVDIGGGSVEVTISTGQNIISTDSYGIGTVRLLEMLNGNRDSKHPFENLVREYTEAARYRIERDLGNDKVQICVGTGGNVEEIGRLRRRLFKAESDRCVTLPELETLIERLDRMSCEERMRKLKCAPTVRC
jgi:exopolyphosphatase/guanosine-5'-triphosphate,3'-diphosphate pyrophosphatase